MTVKWTPKPARIVWSLLFGATFLTVVLSIIAIPLTINGGNGIKNELPAVSLKAILSQAVPLIQGLVAAGLEQSLTALQTAAMAVMWGVYSQAGLDDPASPLANATLAAACNYSVIMGGVAMAAASQNASFMNLPAAAQQAILLPNITTTFLGCLVKQGIDVPTLNKTVYTLL